MEEKQKKLDSNKKTIGFLLIVILIIITTIALFFNQGWSWDTVQHFSVLGIPLGIIIWNFIGNFAAIINTLFSKSLITNPFRWILTRSLLSIFGASIIYLIIMIFFIPKDYSIMYLIFFAIGYANPFTITNSLQNTLAAQIDSPLDDEQILNEKEDGEK